MRAVSVRTEPSATEEEGQREIVQIAGNDCQSSRIIGRLVVENFRGVEVTTTIRRGFSGILIEVDANPVGMLRAEGVLV
jgi:hypothetical protein